MLCSRFLRPHTGETHGTLYNLTESIYQGMLKLYENSLRVVLKHRMFTLVASSLLLVLVIYLFGVLPKGFLPSDDIRPALWD